MSEPKIVWLVVVSFDTLAKPNEKSIHVRTHPYELKGKCKGPSEVWRLYW